MLAKIMFKAS